MHARAILFAVLVSSAGGCYASGGYGYGTTGYVTTPSVNAHVDVAPVQASIDVNGTAAVDVSTPELVSVAPDVQVIVDHDEPIFYSDGYYWRETNGAWYRSTIHTGGWNYFAAAPYAVRSLDRRDSYRRYRPANYVSRRGYDRGYDNRGHVNRGYDNRGGYVRDHRSYDRGYTRPARGYDNRGYGNRGYRDPGPAVRDHRSGYNRGYDRGGYVRNGGATVRAIIAAVTSAAATTIAATVGKPRCATIAARRRFATTAATTDPVATIAVPTAVVNGSPTPCDAMFALRR
jgi:hypothetical protein